MNLFLHEFQFVFAGTICIHNLLQQKAPEVHESIFKEYFIHIKLISYQFHWISQFPVLWDLVNNCFAFSLFG